MHFDSTTFEVVSYIDLKRLIKIVGVQFADTLDSQLLQLTNLLKARSVMRGSKNEIDGYFALRLILKFYQREKKQKITVLANSFHVYTISDQNSDSFCLSFPEFAEFVKESLKNVNELDIARLYRTSWSFGDRKVNFESFLAACELHGYFVRELLLENSSALSLASKRQAIEQKTNNLNFLLQFSHSMGKIKVPILDWWFHDRRIRSNPEFLKSMEFLRILMSGKDSSRPRENLNVMGDHCNMLVESWIMILRSLVSQRTVYLEATRAENTLNKQKSDKLKQQIFSAFFNFIKSLYPEEIVLQKPFWINERIIVFQRKFRSVLRMKARQMHSRIIDRQKLMMK